MDGRLEHEEALLGYSKCAATYRIALGVGEAINTIAKNLRSMLGQNTVSQLIRSYGSESYCK